MYPLVLVSCGCHFDESSASLLNSSSKVHCHPPAGAATGGVEPEHAPGGLGPAEVLVVVPAPGPAPPPPPAAPARPVGLLVDVLDGVDPERAMRRSEVDVVDAEPCVVGTPAARF